MTYIRSEVATDLDFFMDGIEGISSSDAVGALSQQEGVLYEYLHQGLWNSSPQCFFSRYECDDPADLYAESGIHDFFSGFRGQS